MKELCTFIIASCILQTISYAQQTEGASTSTMDSLEAHVWVRAYSSEDVEYADFIMFRHDTIYTRVFYKTLYAVHNQWSNAHAYPFYFFFPENDVAAVSDEKISQFNVDRMGEQKNGKHFVFNYNDASRSATESKYITYLTDSILRIHGSAYYTKKENAYIEKTYTAVDIPFPFDPTIAPQLPSYLIDSLTWTEGKKNGEHETFPFPYQKIITIQLPPSLADSISRLKEQPQLR